MTARRLGFEAEPLDGAGLALSRGGRLRVDRLDDAAWLVQRRGRNRRRIERIGPSILDAALVSRPRSVGKNVNRYLGALSGHLAHEHISWALQRLEANVVLDVGANAGQFAQSLRRGGYRGRIVSFEPVPHALEQLSANAAGDKDWWVRDCALGAEDGTAEINVSPDKVSSLLPASEFGKKWSQKLVDTQALTIDIRRLDSVLDEVTEGIAEPRVYLKLDTQGFDVEVVKGAGDRIREIVGMQSEVAFLNLYEGMPRLPEQLAVYEAAGFEVSGIFSVSRHQPTMRAIEFDLLMVRADEVRG